MKHFTVLVAGENFLLKRDGELKKVSFQATGTVRAASEEDAGDICIDLLIDDPLLRDVENDEDDHIKLSVEEVTEVFGSEISSEIQISFEK